MPSIVSSIPDLGDLTWDQVMADGFDGSSALGHVLERRRKHEVPRGAEAAGDLVTEQVSLFSNFA